MARVLVVDDEPAVLFTLKEVLADAGTTGHRRRAGARRWSGSTAWTR